MADTAPLVAVSDWSEVRFVDLLAASVGRSGDVDRVALPGIQDKVSARMIHVPVARANSRFLLKQFAFAYLTCNGDAHAKNFSVRRDGGEWRPTPMYDVPTSYVYEDHSMALTLNGKVREDIGRADFVAVGAAVGVRAPAVERAVDEL